MIIDRILEVLDKPMTAKQIAAAINKPSPSVRRYLAEMCRHKRIEVVERVQQGSFQIHLYARVKEEEKQVVITPPANWPGETSPEQLRAQEAFYRPYIRMVQQKKLAEKKRKTSRLVKAIS